MGAAAGGITGVTIKAGDKEVRMTPEQWDRGMDTLLGGKKERKLKGQQRLESSERPTVAEMAAAYARMERLAADHQRAKQHVKDLLASSGIALAQEEAKDLKEELTEARAVWDACGRRLQLGLTDEQTGELLGVAQ
jgi:methylthioribose-1-phosphate isomerase